MYLLASVKSKDVQSPLWEISVLTSSAIPYLMVSPPVKISTLEGRGLTSGGGVVAMALGVKGKYDSYLCLAKSGQRLGTTFYELEKVSDIGAILWFMPGILFVVSRLTNQMVRVNYRPGDLAILGEQVVYDFEPQAVVSGLMYYRSFFYAVDAGQQQIIRFRPNNGFEVVKDHVQPDHIGVDRDNLIYYSQPQRKQFTLDDLVVQLAHVPTAIAEDTFEGGLWLALQLPNDQPALQLVDYNGNQGDILPILQPGMSITSMVRMEV